MCAAHTEGARSWPAGALRYCCRPPATGLALSTDARIRWHTGSAPPRPSTPRRDPGPPGIPIAGASAEGPAPQDSAWLFEIAPHLRRRLTNGVSTSARSGSPATAGEGLVRQSLLRPRGQPPQRVALRCPSAGEPRILLRQSLPPLPSRPDGDDGNAPSRHNVLRHL